MKYRVTVESYHYDEFDNTIPGDYVKEVEADSVEEAARRGQAEADAGDTHTEFAGSRVKQIVDENGVTYTKQGDRWERVGMTTVVKEEKDA